MGSSRYDIIKGSTIEQEARTIIEVYTDGASNGNPGISGAGVYIKANGKDYEYALPLEEMSNHEAEFHAIIQALAICISTFTGKIVSLRTDSQIVIYMIVKYHTKHNVLYLLLISLTNISLIYSHFFF